MHTETETAFRPIRGLSGRNGSDHRHSASTTRQACKHSRTLAPAVKTFVPDSDSDSDSTQHTCRRPPEACASPQPRGRIALASHDAAAGCHAKNPKVPGRRGGLDDSAQAARVAGLVAGLAALPAFQPQPVQAVRVHHQHIALEARLRRGHTNGVCGTRLCLLSRAETGWRHRHRHRHRDAQQLARGRLGRA